MPKKSTFFNEFKTFISRGSVMDMAVGIIVGTAFTAIVNSLVKDMLMPIIGLILGGVSFTDLKFVITAATDQTAEVAINWGTFIQRIVDFLIISFVVFVMVRSLNTRVTAGAEERRGSASSGPRPPHRPMWCAHRDRDLLKERLGRPCLTKTLCGSISSTCSVAQLDRHFPPKEGSCVRIAPGAEKRSSLPTSFHIQPNCPIIV